MGDCRKGRRPNFMAAAKPDYAVELYNSFINCCRNMGVNVETWVFQAHMMVRINNDGPVTVLIDSKKVF
jgi:D-tyrosyl-tRNA(Tyr) deacylase